MQCSLLRYLFFLAGICILLHTEAVPLSGENTLSLPVETSITSWSEAAILKRVPGRADRKEDVKRPSKKRPSKKRPSTKRPSTKRPSTKRPAEKSSQKAPTKSPDLAKSKPVKPLPYKRPKRPTKAYDVCYIPGFGCLTELDDTDNNPSLLSPRADKTALVGRGDYALSKRGPFGSKPGESRLFKIKFSPTDILTIYSKPYFTSQELFSTQGLTLTKAYADYATDDLRNKAIKIFASPQNRLKPGLKRAQPSKYATEHIIELQTIARFIETVTLTTNKNRDSHPVKLSKTVDKTFFQKQFAKSYKRRVPDRPLPPADLLPADPPNRSIMDNVFEALGSKTNAQDFVLCEWGINTVKMKLWSNFEPAPVENTMEMASDAADGSIPSNVHLSIMRTVLAVYEYMEAVSDRMQNEIQNVKTELGNVNIKSIVRDDAHMPRDKDGNIADLGELWQEYMQKLLARFERKGVNWLKKQIHHALSRYEEELQRLQKYVSRFKAEEDEPSRAKKQEMKNKRIEKENTYKTRLNLLKKELAAAIKIQTNRKTEFNEIAKQVLALDDKEEQNDKKVELKYEDARKASRAADDKAYEAKKKVGLMNRKIIQTDPKEFRFLVQDVKDDIAQLVAYQKVVETLDTKVKDEELRLKLKYMVL